MRTVLLGDIIAAARALLAMPDSDHTTEIGRMLDQAHAAHLYHKRNAKPHPEWGNGSLMSRAGGAGLAAEPFTSNTQYLMTLQAVIVAIIARKAHFTTH